MHRMQRRKYEKMPLTKLRRLRNELHALITELENGPRREIDIADSHTGDPTLIARVLRVIGDKTSGKWIQVERIFCSQERCHDCPHGDYLYEYRQNTKRGTTTVRFKGKGFDLDNLRFFEFTPDRDAIIIHPPSPRTEGMG
jgi:hypothetical protein